MCSVLQNVMCPDSERKPLVNIQNCDFQAMSTEDFLEEVFADDGSHVQDCSVGLSSVENIPTSSENHDVSPVALPSVSGFTGPVFQNVQKVHIHYYVNNDTKTQ